MKVHEKKLIFEIEFRDENGRRTIHGCNRRMENDLPLSTEEEEMIEAIIKCELMSMRMQAKQKGE